MSDDSLLSRHDAILFDLDGTLYRGTWLLPWSADMLTEARRHGKAIRFVTNNASKTPVAVAEHLNILGLSADSNEINTSAQAAGRLLQERIPQESVVLVVGAESLVAEIQNQGIRSVRHADEHVAAVVQGHSQDTGWVDLAEACLAIRDGAEWIACNLDSTLPTERGQLPGNGAMVAALRAATGQEPDVAGKPDPILLRAAANSAAARSPLVVGDRLDTDIAGAVAAGYDSLVVLTGVSTPARLLMADAPERPRYLAADLSGLNEPSEQLEIGPQCGWRVSLNDTSMTVTSVGGKDRVALLRALCDAAWRYGVTTVTGTCDRSTAALAELGLA